MFNDEAAPTAESAASEAPAAPRLRRRGEPTKYGEPAFMDSQLRISDLVPKSYLAIGLWFTLGAAAIAGLEALYFWMPALAKSSTDGAVAAFDLDGEGSLAVWFSSLLLGLSALVSLFIFVIRRHKADDYHGRYRIWLWAALVWLVMSIDETGSLHEGFKELMTQASGSRIHGDGSLWWVLGYGLVFLAICTRLVFQLKSSRAAIAAFVLAFGCYGAAVATQLELIMPQSGARGIMLEEGLEMAADLLLLASLTLFARYVVLESQGLLYVKQARSKKVRANKQTATSEGDKKPADGKSPAKTESGVGSAPRPALVSAVKGQQLRVDPPQSLQSDRRLSKAERRALKRQDGDRYSDYS